MSDLRDKVIIPTDWMLPMRNVTLGFSNPALFVADVIKWLEKRSKNPGQVVRVELLNELRALTPTT